MKDHLQREEGNRKKPQSDYLNLGRMHAHTHTKEDTNPTIKTASSQEWLASSQDERLRASLLLLHIRDDSFYYKKVNKDSTSQVICSLYIQPIYPGGGGGGLPNRKWSVRTDNFVLINAQINGFHFCHSLLHRSYEKSFTFSLLSFTFVSPTYRNLNCHKSQIWLDLCCNMVPHLLS